jgi:hypothetical protein
MQNNNAAEDSDNSRRFILDKVPLEENDRSHHRRAEKMMDNTQEDRCRKEDSEVDPERETAGTGWLVMVRTGKVNTWDGV